MIDGGMVAEDVEFRVSVYDITEASAEELGSIRRLGMYSNQQYSMERDIMTGDVRFRIRYHTPVITTVKEHRGPQ